MKFDIHNPSKTTPRCIWDGIDKRSDPRPDDAIQMQTLIRIDPGETKRGIELAPHIVQHLRGLQDDLLLRASENQPEQAPPVAPKPQPARAQAR